MGFEREIKIRVKDLKEIEDKVVEMGGKLKSHRFERNFLWDRNDELFRRGEALRLRIYGKKAILTFKGKAQKDPYYKVREEVETEISNPQAVEAILKKLGFSVAFYYEKERKNFLLDGVLISLDRTPLGNFMEVEGEAEKIDLICRKLGFSKKDYIKKTYVEMALERGVRILKF